MPTGLTIDQARGLLSEHYMQDIDKDRDDNTELDLVLANHVQSTLGWFIDEGGLLYSEILDLTTAAAGTLDLSSYNVLMIHGVSQKSDSGDYFRPMHEEQLMNVRRTVTRAITLRLVITRTPSTSGWSTGSNPFINHASTILPFEHLVCVNAALELAAGDADHKSALRQVKADLEDKVSKMRRPGQSSLAASGRRRSGFSYAYRHDTQTLFLCA